MELTSESKERLDNLRNTGTDNEKWLTGLVDALMAQNLGLKESVRAYTSNDQAKRPTKDSRAAAWERVKDDTLRRVTDIKYALEQQVIALEKELADLKAKQQ